MKSKFTLFLFIVVFVTSPIFSQSINTTSPQKKIALVIGNGNYLSGSILANPENDARAIKIALQNVGFTVLEYENLKLVQLKQAIDDFGAKLKSNDVGLFFYAGHGIQSKGYNYLIPVDAQLQSEQQVEYDCVQADRILALMEASGTNVNILILDACRNNPFERSWTRAATGRGLAFMNAPSGSLIAYATSPGSTASDGSGNNGLYTSAILESMKIPNITILEMFQNVRNIVTQKSNKQQIPWESTSLTGNFYFNTGNYNVTEEMPIVETSKPTGKISFISDYTIENLTGNVKSISEMDWLLLMENGEYPPLSAYPRSKTKTLFNEQGYCIRRTSEGEKGEIESVESYIFNDNLPTGKEWAFPKENKKSVSSINIISTFEMEQISRNEFNDEVKSYIKYILKDNKIIRKIHVFEEKISGINEVSKTTTNWDYEYDSQGQLSKMILYNTNEPYLITSWYFKYIKFDKFNNWTIRYMSAKPDFKTISYESRQIEYYSTLANNNLDFSKESNNRIPVVLTKSKNDWKAEGLGPNVKSQTIKSYYTNFMLGNKMVQDTMRFLLGQKKIFDEQGFLKERISIDSEGKQKYKYVPVKENGKLIYWTAFNKTDSIINPRSQQRRWISDSVYVTTATLNAAFKGTTTIYNDTVLIENGQETKVFRNIKTIIKSNQIKGKRTFAKIDSTFERKIILYSYNNEGLTVGIYNLQGLEKIQTVKYVYIEFDTNNNWTKRVTYYPPDFAKPKDIDFAVYEYY